MNIYDKYRNLYILDSYNTIIMTKIDINTYLILYKLDDEICELSNHDIEYIYDPDFHERKTELSTIYTDKYYNNVSILFNRYLNKMIKIHTKITKICNGKINYDKLCEIYNIYNAIKLYEINDNVLIEKDKFYSNLYHKIHVLLNFDLIMDVKLLIMKKLIL